MRLYFLRHADADAATRWTDAERPLSTIGVEQATAVAEAMRSMETAVGTIFSSPLLRAKQTAEIVGRQFPSVKIQTLEQLRPDSEPEGLLRELQSMPRDTRALIVSHEPFVSRCIGRLISTGGEQYISIKKASLACVEVGLPVQRGSGVLLWLMTNEILRLITR